MTEPRTHPDEVDLAWPDAQVRAHLVGCVRCRDRAVAIVADQDAARLALAPLAGPVPLPPDVAGRIAQALAEQDAGASTRPVDADDLPAPGAPGLGGAVRAGATRWLLAAAAAAVVVVGATVVVPRLGGGEDLSAPGTAGQDGAERDSGGTTSESTAEPSGDSPSAAAGGTGTQPPEAGAEELAPGLPALPGDLLAVAGTLTSPGAAPQGCGEPLASALGGAVVAAAAPAAAGEPGVLVVVTVPGGGTERQAWWLPTCTGLPDDALGASPIP